MEAELVQAGEGGELLRPRLLARQRHVDVDSALPDILQSSRGALKVQGNNVNPPCMLAWLVKSIQDSWELPILCTVRNTTPPSLCLSRSPCQPVKRNGILLQMETCHGCRMDLDIDPETAALLGVDHEGPRALHPPQLPGHDCSSGRV